MERYNYIKYLESKLKEMAIMIEEAYKAGHRNHISDEDHINEYWESYKACKNLKN